MERRQPSTVLPTAISAAASKTEGKFALDPYYAGAGTSSPRSDETFRRFYNLDSRLKTDRVSQIYLEGLHDRNYISTRFYNTQSLLFTDEPFSDATVFPIIDYDYIVNKPDHRRRALLQFQRHGVFTTRMASIPIA